MFQMIENCRAVLLQSVNTYLFHVFADFIPFISAEEIAQCKTYESGQ